MYSVDMWKMPAAITLANPNDEAPDVMDVTLSVDRKGNRDVCEILAGSAAAVAGAIDGRLGAVGALGALFCKIEK